MSEGEFNIDSEFEALLNGEVAVTEEVLKQRSYERKKLPFSLESVMLEKEKLVEDFYDHYASLTQPDATDTFQTVDDFLLATSAPNDPYSDAGEDMFESGIIPKLNELMQKSVEQDALMASGEMQISGEGLFLFMPDTGQGVLGEGATLIGDISQYAALPAIPYENFLRMQQGEEGLWASSSDEPVELPSPWMLMENAILYDANGMQQMNFDTVMLPMTYPDLYFSKVVRQDGEILKTASAEYVPLATHFTAEFMLTVYTDIENNLNHNQFDYDEFREEYELLRRDVGVYMMVVDVEKDILLSASQAILADGTLADLHDQVVQYIEPTIMKYKDAWRIAHAFVIQAEDGDFNVAHVLPEHISGIDYLNDQ